jgi:hypothetical protein
MKFNKPIPVIDPRLVFAMYQIDKALAERSYVKEAEGFNLTKTGFSIDMSGSGMGNWVEEVIGARLKPTGFSLRRQGDKFRIEVEGGSRNRPTDRGTKGRKTRSVRPDPSPSTERDS